MNLYTILNNDYTRATLGSGSPVSHYDADGKLLSLQEYNASLQAFDDVIKTEHLNVISATQKTLLEMAFNALGDSYEAAVKGNIFTAALNLANTAFYAADSAAVTALKVLTWPLAIEELEPVISVAVNALDARTYIKAQNELSQESPISHYAQNNEPKSMQAFIGEWQAKKLDLETYHRDMVSHETISYPKCVLNNLGKFATDITQANLFAAAKDLTLAAGYSVAGLADTSFWLLDGFCQAVHTGTSEAYKYATQHSQHSVNDTHYEDYDVVSHGIELPTIHHDYSMIVSH